MFKAIKDILVLETENNCISQMAEGYLRHFARHRAIVYSAGLEIDIINPYAIQVMLEDGIDISNQTSNRVDEYTNSDLDLILTVCNNAEINCPSFSSNPLRFHYNFINPMKSNSSEVEIINDFRKTRDMIKAYCEKFLKIHLYSNSQSFDGFKL